MKRDILSANVRSAWPDAPNEQRQREERIHPVLRTGQHDAAMAAYYKNVRNMEHKRRAALAKRNAERAAALTLQ